MAAIRSLGVHTPVALPYLTAEGLLPSDAGPEQYQWETYLVDDGPDQVEGEILATRNTVVWSHGRFIRNIYRFRLEAEEVVQAVLTRFVAPGRSQKDGLSSGSDVSQRSRHTLNRNSIASSAFPKSNGFHDHQSADRALVILLKTKAHIHFLRGSSHIVELPFEVIRAFPAPRGLLLQRKNTRHISVPSTPQIPLAPPNSFWSSQALSRSSLGRSVSPTLVKSFAKTGFTHDQQVQTSPWNGNVKLEALFQQLTARPNKIDDDEVTNLYSLSSPFADLGVVTYSLQNHRPRIPGRPTSGPSVEFEGLDPGERIVYVTATDELSPSPGDKVAPLMLLVTFNVDLSIITVWHAWYIEERSLDALLKVRAQQKEAKSRRRSSFLSANIGTGATTPAVRRRDGPRDSFVATGQLGDVAASQTVSRKPTREDEEEAFASQMDPDYIPTASQQPARETRRVSSMNNDVRTSQTTVNASFGAATGRRATSFGTTHGRRSLNHRKSRGSTPGSMYGNSMGGEDDTMDLDTTVELDTEESADDVLQHMRATLLATGTDGVFGNLDEGFRREVIVRKLHSFSFESSSSSSRHNGDITGESAPFKAFALRESPLTSGAEDVRINVMVHNRRSGEVQVVSLKVKVRPLWPGQRESLCVAVPLVIGNTAMDRCEDIAVIRDDYVRGVLLHGQGVLFTLDEHAVCPLPGQAPYRVSDELGTLDTETQIDKETGKNRILPAPPPPTTLKSFGSRGAYDEVTNDRTRHSRRCQIRGEHSQTEALLAICEIMLPKSEARQLRKTWCMILAWLIEHPERMWSTACDSEVVALTSTIFVFIFGLFDKKGRAAINLAGVAAGRAKENSSATTVLRKGARDRDFANRPAWSWIPYKQATPSRQSSMANDVKRDYLLVIAANIAEELAPVQHHSTNSQPPSAVAVLSATKIMLALHVHREEQRSSTLNSSLASAIDTGPIVAQLGIWLNRTPWGPYDGSYYNLAGFSEDRWAFVKYRSSAKALPLCPDTPTGVLEWFEHTLAYRRSEPYLSLATIAKMGSDTLLAKQYESATRIITPRLAVLSDLVTGTKGLSASPVMVVDLLAQYGVDPDMLETYPVAIAAPFREAVSRCEKEPPTTWRIELLQLVGREDLNTDVKAGESFSRLRHTLHEPSRDVHTVCGALDQPILQSKTREAGRHAVSQLLFMEDRRLLEAMSIMHFNSTQVVQCPKAPDWDDDRHFQNQRKMVQWATVRMIALPIGDAMLHYDSQAPLLTERYHLPGFSSSCLIQPMGYHLAPERTGLTEEKVNWAYFHAGVSAGLRISHRVRNIDTSWLAFNKPPELQNRHAGLLLALGLGGHLRHVAKWLLFKYLTPKHTMTSVGLLLGLSASYIGTMDGLVTRMLSVHITRMLPAGAAELNVTPATQAAGMMGIGLVYFNTQHRRMSEVMLSEIEYMEVEDPDSGPDPLRDESYRLATGFALGLINIHQGDALRGLHGMQLAERLFKIAVGPRPVTAVHVFDRATAGAVIAIALIYMKTGNKTVASKVDIPDTEAQFDQVRPDILMLRAMAKHVILWDHIEAKGIVNGDPGWIQENMPSCFRNRQALVTEEMLANRNIDSAHIPLFSVYTGLAWALSLKYAGSGNILARDEILELLKFVYNLSSGAVAIYFDGKLGRAALRRCMDALAVCAAVVMAGSGDLETFRHLRRMHGRVDPDTSYGSHLAAHMAIGLLFLGGGTYTLGTSDLATAALICALYPLYPNEVQDNRVHLQAFRHLWVLAAEARCLVVEEIDTQRPIQMPILVTSRDGSQQAMQAPCLLPDLATIAKVQTNNPSYWRVTLDFARNPAHQEYFRKEQRLFVRRCPAAEAHSSIFSAALAAMNDAHIIQAAGQQIWHMLFDLQAFKDLDRADVESLLPPDVNSSIYLDKRSSVVDDRLVLSKAVTSLKMDELWNLRLLFAWADRAKNSGDGRLQWIGHEVVESLKARIEERSRQTA